MRLELFYPSIKYNSCKIQNLANPPRSVKNLKNI